MAQSIVEKLANKVFNQAANKVVSSITNKAFNAVGLGDKKPRKLMPHELQELLEESKDDQFSLNKFSGRQYWTKNGVENPVNDISLMQLKVQLSEKHNLRLTKTDLREAVQLACHSNPFSPIQRFLEGLPAWDGTDRIPELLKLMNPVIIDSDHEALMVKFLRCFLVGCVVRAMEPGSKQDDVLVLRGKQRTGKSTVFRVLASAPYFRDTMFDIESKEGWQSLVGCWIYELSELNALRAKSPDAIKSFLSSQIDYYRDPWGKQTEPHPRSCVFTATTNQERFLTDATGSGRFHCIETGMIDTAAIGVMRDALWGQAMALYNQGTSHWLDAADLEKSEKLNEKFKV
jgi:predicted P-loop ATPase